MGMESMMSGGGSVIGDLVTGWVNNQYAEDRQNSAQNFSAEQYAKRWQTTTADMKAAGLNPMLAYSQGVGSSPSGAAASSNATPSLSQAWSKGSVASAQTANIEADTANKEAQADLIRAQAAHAWASAGQATSNTGLIDETVKKVQAETAKIKGDTNFEQQQQLLKNTVFNVYQQGVLAQEKGMSEGQSRALMQATIAKILTDTQLRNLDLNAALKFDNFGREYKQYESVIELFKHALRK